MTTSELIKLLQAEDPSGNAHIRLSDGVIIGVERKPGYWDGAYYYIDENKRYVRSTRNEKIDIHTITSEDYIWDNHMDYNPYLNDKNAAWQRLKDLFVFDTYESKHNEDIKDSFYNNLKKEFDEYCEYMIDYSKKLVNELITNIENGFKYQFFEQNERFDKWRVVNDKGETLNNLYHGYAEALKYNNSFKSIIVDNHIEYIINNG